MYTTIVFNTLSVLVQEDNEELTVRGPPVVNLCFGKVRDLEGAINSTGRPSRYDLCPASSSVFLCVIDVPFEERRALFHPPALERPTAILAPGRRTNCYEIAKGHVVAPLMYPQMSVNNRRAIHDGQLLNFNVSDDLFDFGFAEAILFFSFVGF